MEITEIVRRGRKVLVRVMKVSELDKKRCSHKFLSHEFQANYPVYVKCFSNGEPDFRGKHGEYRIIIPDKLITNGKY